MKNTHSQEISESLVLRNAAPELLTALLAGVKLVFQIQERLELEGHEEWMRSEIHTFHAEAAKILSEIPIRYRMR